MAAPSPLLVPRAVLLAALGVSAQTLTDWRREGMPGRSAHGRYDLRLVLPWVRRRDLAAAAARSGPLAEEKRRLIVEQRRGHELDNAQRAASLLPRSVVLDDVDAYRGILDAVLDRLPDVAADVAAVAGDQRGIQRVLTAACRRVRIDLATAVADYGRTLAEPASERPNGHGAG